MNVKADTSKTTMLTISMGFLLIFLAFHWRWALFVSLGVGILGIASDFLSKKVEWAWMKLSKLLGYVVPNILLSAIFFAFLFPIAAISRLFGKKDPMMLSGKYKTYFIEVNTTMDKKSFEKTW